MNFSTIKQLVLNPSITKKFGDYRCEILFVIHPFQSNVEPFLSMLPENNKISEVFRCFEETQSESIALECLNMMVCFCSFSKFQKYKEKPFSFSKVLKKILNRVIFSEVSGLSLLIVIFQVFCLRFRSTYFTTLMATFVSEVNCSCYEKLSFQTAFWSFKKSFFEQDVNWCINKFINKQTKTGSLVFFLILHIMIADHGFQ